MCLVYGKLRVYRTCGIRAIRALMVSGFRFRLMLDAASEVLRSYLGAFQLPPWGAKAQAAKLP